MGFSPTNIAVTILQSPALAFPAVTGALRKNRIALAPAFAHYAPMLARVLSAAVNGIEAFPVEVEFNCGWGAVVTVMLICEYLESTWLRFLP